MAFTLSQKAEIEKVMADFMERNRPPENIRDKLDFDFDVTGQSVEIFEIRPAFNKPSEKHNSPVAKTTYVRTRDIWKVYWMRSDAKWHSYPPVPSVGSFKKFIQLVEKDEHHCFWG
ncbi:MAG: DUF3024 domain-containing protein [Bacteroidota bacterium]